MRRAFTSMAVGLLLAAAGCDRGDHPDRVGRVAPEFRVSDDASTVDLARLRGRVVVLNLWATWCAPCLQELPSLIALQQQMPELAVVGISIDESPEVYRAFLDRRHVNFTTVRDPSARINALYGTSQIPETYVIDRNGMLRRKFVSAQVWTSPEIMDYLRRL